MMNKEEQMMNKEEQLMMSNVTKQLSQKHMSMLISFSPFHCCSNVVLRLEKGGYPEHSHAVFCHNKYSFEPFMCFGSCFRTLAAILVSELLVQEHFK